MPTYLWGSGSSSCWLLTRLIVLVNCLLCHRLELKYSSFFITTLLLLRNPLSLLVTSMFTYINFLTKTHPVMPVFHHSVAVLPFRYTAAVVPFRSDVAIAADWLSSYARMAKIGFYLIAMERQLRRNRRWQQQRNFSHKQRNSYSAYVICLRSKSN